ncbi:hypothetical protein [Bdellovibrio sp. HCB2-146]|uniref:hypothetical protein n=1 Tax=Bdellovibrio sp. HCB2-146 TaxID=3394362 RepID=UPI0039BD881E
MGEKSLAETVIEATGLPTTAVEKEFNKLLNNHGTTAEDMTMDDLREMMAEYLQTVFLELAEQENSAAS